jgi:hypothetical protein
VEILTQICLLLYVLVITLVGVRMLLLARRTGGRPERLIAAGSLLVAAVGFPSSVASGFGKPAGAVNVPLWVASELTTQVGLVLLYLFTQQVFRPGTAWAKAIVAAAGAVMLTGLAGAAHALAAADASVPSVVAVRGWLLTCMAGYAGCFAWSTAEALHQHRMALRRLALGLVDPVVANRFLLWGIYGLGASGIMLANVVGTILGVDISTSPIVGVPSGALALVASGAVYLAFLPPGRYLRFVRARAGAGPRATPA